MTAPVAVDVISVLNSIWHEGLNSKNVNDFEKARAAVAELISAADQVSFSRRGQEDWERLDNALERCGGAQ